VTDDVVLMPTALALPTRVWSDPVHHITWMRGGFGMENDGQGWKLFAGIMVLLVGVFNVIDGLRAITNASQITGRFPNGEVQLPLTNNIKTWGWLVLIIGAVMILAGFLIFSGNMFGRIVGVVIAFLNAVVQLSYLDHNTFWSFTMILVDVLIIYGLVAHGGRIQDDWARDTSAS
jgi:hypothetical protein